MVQSKQRPNNGKATSVTTTATSSSGSNKNSMNATSIERAAIVRLRRRIQAECPARGYAPPLNQKVSFRALPISDATLRGLEEGNSGGNGSGNNSGGGRRNNKTKSKTNNNNRATVTDTKNNLSNKKQFWTMTDIQNACIPHALLGRDILGAARTGSGKTLAFLIPLIEKLYRRKYTPDDGPGAIVLSPTRELAVQTFQVLRNIGKYHHLSAGLLVGGKKEFGLEQQHVPNMNIIIATPGRLLQHLEQTAGLNVDRVCLLVLDEADRILDMGFREQMVRILDYLPPGNDGNDDDDIANDDDDDDDDEVVGRQTMLFSATQTKKVSDLAALSLHRPEYLGVHDKETSKTPIGLEQTIMIVPLQHKLNALYSFIKSHLKAKTIIFLSSCSQVRHVWSIFCTMQPGIPLMALHGKLKQETRTRLYFDYLQRPHAVLFATDVAARGLDFPSVDWVVQADAPEDVDMYIHRVGRTARYNSGGKALLLVTPQEEAGGLMKTLVDDAKMNIKICNMNPDKAILVTTKAAAIVASSPDINLLAKKAFKSYLRSVYLMPNKSIYPSDMVLSLPLDEYATSLGLASTPTVRFLKKLSNREDERKKKNVDYRLIKLKEEIKAERLMKKINKLGSGGGEDTSEMKKKQQGKRSSSSDEDSGNNTDDDNNTNTDLLVVKKVHNWGDESSTVNNIPQINLHEASKSRHLKKIRIDGSTTGINQKIVFTDDGGVEDTTISNQIIGNAVTTTTSTTTVTALPASDNDLLVSAREEYLQKVRNRLSKTKELDRQEEKERIQDKHKKRKLKDRSSDGGDDERTTIADVGSDDNDGGRDTVVTLGRSINSDDDDNDDQSSNSSNDSDNTDAEQDGDLYEDNSNSDDDDDDEYVDVKAQEELALAMLGN